MNSNLYSIPRIKKQNGANFIPLSPTDREALDLISEVDRTCVEHNHAIRKQWSVSSIQHIHPSEMLEVRYRQKRGELKEQGGIRLTNEILGFFILSNQKQANSIARDGLRAMRSWFFTLGDSSKGVYLFKYLDIALMSKADMENVRILVFKVLSGRVKHLPLASFGTVVEPTPNYDAHTSQNAPIMSDTSSSIINNSLIYLYEYTEDAVPSSYPSQCLPYALIEFTNTCSISCTRPDKVNEPTALSAVSAGWTSFRRFSTDVGRKSVKHECHAPVKDDSASRMHIDCTSSAKSVPSTGKCVTNYMHAIDSSLSSSSHEAVSFDNKHTSSTVDTGTSGSPRLYASVPESRDPRKQRSIASIIYVSGNYKKSFDNDCGLTSHSMEPSELEVSAIDRRLNLHQLNHSPTPGDATSCPSLKQMDFGLQESGSMMDSNLKNFPSADMQTAPLSLDVTLDSSCVVGSSSSVSPTANGRACIRQAVVSSPLLQRLPAKSVLKKTGCVSSAVAIRQKRKMSLIDYKKRSEEVASFCSSEGYKEDDLERYSTSLAESDVGVPDMPVILGEVGQQCADDGRGGGWYAEHLSPVDEAVDTGRGGVDCGHDTLSNAPDMTLWDDAQMSESKTVFTHSATDSVKSGDADLSGSSQYTVATPCRHLQNTASTAGRQLKGDYEEMAGWLTVEEVDANQCHYSAHGCCVCVENNSATVCGVGGKETRSSKPSSSEQLSSGHDDNLKKSELACCDNVAVCDVARACDVSANFGAEGSQVLLTDTCDDDPCFDNVLVMSLDDDVDGDSCGDGSAGGCAPNERAHTPDNLQNVNGEDRGEEDHGSGKNISSPGRKVSSEVFADSDCDVDFKALVRLSKGLRPGKRIQIEGLGKNPSNTPMKKLCDARRGKATKTSKQKRDGKGGGKLVPVSTNIHSNIVKFGEPCTISASSNDIMCATSDSSTSSLRMRHSARTNATVQAVSVAGDYDWKTSTNARHALPFGLRHWTESQSMPALNPVVVLVDLFQVCKNMESKCEGSFVDFVDCTICRKVIDGKLVNDDVLLNSLRSNKWFDLSNIPSKTNGDVVSSLNLHPIMSSDLQHCEAPLPSNMASEPGTCTTVSNGNANIAETEDIADVLLKGDKFAETLFKQVVCKPNINGTVCSVSSCAEKMCSRLSNGLDIANKISKLGRDYISSQTANGQSCDDSLHAGSQNYMKLITNNETNKTHNLASNFHGSASLPSSTMLSYTKIVNTFLRNSFPSCINTSTPGFSPQHTKPRFLSPRDTSGTFSPSRGSTLLRPVYSVCSQGSSKENWKKWKQEMLLKSSTVPPNTHQDQASNKHGGNEITKCHLPPHSESEVCQLACDAVLTNHRKSLSYFYNKTLDASTKVQEINNDFTISDSPVSVHRAKYLEQHDDCCLSQFAPTTADPFISNNRPCSLSRSHTPGSSLGVADCIDNGTVVDDQDKTYVHVSHALFPECTSALRDVPCSDATVMKSFLRSDHCSAETGRHEWEVTSQGVTKLEATITAQRCDNAHIAFASAMRSIEDDCTNIHLTTSPACSPAITAPSMCIGTTDNGGDIVTPCVETNKQVPEIAKTEKNEIGCVCENIVSDVSTALLSDIGKGSVKERKLSDENPITMSESFVRTKRTRSPSGVCDDYVPSTIVILPDSIQRAESFTEESSMNEACQITKREMCKKSFEQGNTAFHKNTASNVKLSTALSITASKPPDEVPTSVSPSVITPNKYMVVVPKCRSDTQCAHGNQGSTVMRTACTCVPYRSDSCDGQARQTASHIFTIAAQHMMASARSDQSQHHSQRRLRRDDGSTCPRRDHLESTCSIGGKPYNLCSRDDMYCKKAKTDKQNSKDISVTSEIMIKNYCHSTHPRRFYADSDSVKSKLSSCTKKECDASFASICTAEIYQSPERAYNYDSSANSSRASSFVHGDKRKESSCMPKTELKQHTKRCKFQGKEPVELKKKSHFTLASICGTSKEINDYNSPLLNMVGQFDRQVCEQGKNITVGSSIFEKKVSVSAENKHSNLVNKPLDVLYLAKDILIQKLRDEENSENEFEIQSSASNEKYDAGTLSVKGRIIDHHPVCYKTSSWRCGKDDGNDNTALFNNAACHTLMKDKISGQRPLCDLVDSGRRCAGRSFKSEQRRSPDCFNGGHVTNKATAARNRPVRGQGARVLMHEHSSSGVFTKRSLRQDDAKLLKVVSKSEAAAIPYFSGNSQSSDTSIDIEKRIGTYSPLKRFNASIDEGSILKNRHSPLLSHPISSMHNVLHLNANRSLEEFPVDVIEHEMHLIEHSLHRYEGDMGKSKSVDCRVSQHTVTDIVAALHTVLSDFRVAIADKQNQHRGRPHHCLPSSLLHSFEKDGLYTKDNVFVILMQSISRKAFNRLSDVRVRMENCMHKMHEAVCDNDTCLLGQEKERLHALKRLRANMMRSFTGTVNSSRMKKLTVCRRRYSTCSRHLMTSFDQKTVSDMAYFNATFAAIHSHLEIVKKEIGNY